MKYVRYFTNFLTVSQTLRTEILANIDATINTSANNLVQISNNYKKINKSTYRNYTKII